MSDTSGISWTDATWNPTVGCTRVSEGCDHCYAFALHDQRHVAYKRGRMPNAPAQYHQPFSTVQALADRLDAPLHWRKPRRVFVNSMSDLFHEHVPDEFIDRVFAVMALTPWHTYQVLTKRPERMQRYASALTMDRIIDKTNENVDGGPHGLGAYSLSSTAHKTFRARQRAGERDPYRLADPPLPNVWLGVSVENQRWADERIPLLLQTPAAVRFISAEPLLGPVDILQSVNRLSWLDPASMQPGGIDWVIVGGESGAHNRALDLTWVQSIRDQCRAAGVAYFGKQASGSRPGVALPGELGDQEFPVEANR